MHGSPHQYSIAWENPAKLTPWKEPVILVLILFPKYESFFSIRFLSYGILYHIGNTWGFPSIYHANKKCSKTHPVGEPESKGGSL